MSNVHYIYMAGMHGYLPNVCDVAGTLDDAVDSLAQIHELGRTRRERLKRERYLELHLYGEGILPDDGNEYCEITECTCDNPSIHSDSE